MSKLTLQENLNNVPVLILKNIIIFPKNIVPVLIGKSYSVNSVENAYSNSEKKLIFITNEKTENESELNQIGTLAQVIRLIKMPNGNIKVLLEGISRAKANLFLKDETNNITSCNDIEILKTRSNVSEIDLEASWRNFSNAYELYNKYNQKLPENIIGKHLSKDEMELIVDTVTPHLSIKYEDKKNILEYELIEERIKTLTFAIENEIEIIQTEEKIRNNIQSQIELNQKEYYLNEQLKAIQKELKRENEDNFIENSKKRAEELNLNGECLEKFQSELSKLEYAQPFSSEANVSRNYIETILNIPWNKSSKDTVSIIEAKEILDKNHYGLEKVKDQIIELMSAKKYSKKKISPPVICLVGPPGVGKTSLGESIAKCLNKEFVKISLGGVKDEAEIRGHRRTYIGSMPGKIIHGMKKAKTIDPVFLLDEIDKMSHDTQGDPSSVFLEILDPEQNKTFVDNYLDMPYDLSKVFFIATANHIDLIPLPLLDRMEIISLSGYTKDEKLSIAKNFLIPKQIKNHGIEKNKIEFDEDSIDTIIQEYTREAGVRNLSRLITRCIRKVIQKFLENKNLKSYKIIKKDIANLLGIPPFKMKSNLGEKRKPGIATGLAWTEVGGDVLEIESATIKSGKGNLILTGQLGEVMQESAQAAFTYLKINSKLFGINSSKISQSDIHIHIPEGATPKDGPSAGITMCTSLISLFTEIPVASDLAMTGEITLQGRVLPIGGIKEKILAAQTYGYKKVLIPKENKEYCEDEIKGIKNLSLKIIYVEDMNEVLKNALIKNPFLIKKKIKKEKSKSK